MDCYDWKGCPVNDGGCELCDLYIDGVSGWRFPWLRVRRFFIRLVRWDWSAGRVDMTPPSAAEREGVTPMTYDEFRRAWDALSKEQKDRVRSKARWERMSLWAVLREWPALRKGA